MKVCIYMIQESRIYLTVYEVSSRIHILNMSYYLRLLTAKPVFKCLARSIPHTTRLHARFRASEGGKRVECLIWPVPRITRGSAESGNRHTSSLGGNHRFLPAATGPRRNMQISEATHGCLAISCAPLTDDEIFHENRFQWAPRAT
jgi:hypothetical protein